MVGEDLRKKCRETYLEEKSTKFSPKAIFFVIKSTKTCFKSAFFRRPELLTLEVCKKVCRAGLEPGDFSGSLSLNKGKGRVRLS